MKKNIFVLLVFSLFLYSCNKEDHTLVENTNIKQSRDVFFNVKTLDAPTTKASLQTSKKWINGQTLKIKFINGTQAQQKFVKETAAEWLKYANLKFEYIGSGTADIKIAFDWKGDYTTWSYVGTECTFIPQNMPSTNFGFLDEDVFEYDETKAQVLQIFGRILGLTYEHQSPASTIKWKTPLLINYFRTMGWNEKEVNDFFVGLNSEESQYTEFDPKSIMVYNVPPKFAENGYGVNLNTELSQSDILFIKKIYPKGYYNGYEHDLDEPDWEKLKKIDGAIGGTRDKDGNYYFYPYCTGGIYKYDKSLTNKSLLGNAYNWNSNENAYRDGVRIIPNGENNLLVRKGYISGARILKGLSIVNLDKSGNEYQAHEHINTDCFGGLTYDYDREYLYHNDYIYDKNFKEIGSFIIDTRPQWTLNGILYWGNKYKWTVTTHDTGNIIRMDGEPTFYVYGQTDRKDVTSKSNLIATIPVKNFTLGNGAYSNIYEYKDKLVIVNFGSSSQYGKILVMSVDGKYKIYTVQDAKWAQTPSSNDHFCGGFYWKHKLMVYGENYGKWYFEIPELMD